jgi:hypothetical protein
MKKNEIEGLLRTEFRRHSWQLESVAKLPPAFLRATDVTSFFQARVLRQSDGSCVIDGFVGFVSRSFEAAWQKTYNVNAKINSHCLAFHIANIPELRALQSFYDLDPIRVGQFQLALSDILSTFPDSNAAACDVLEAGKLGNFPLEQFAVYGRDEKRSLLKAHVCRGRLH